jgi:hypothetical protein
MSGDDPRPLLSSLHVSSMGGACRASHFPPSFLQSIVFMCLHSFQGSFVFPLAMAVLVVMVMEEQSGDDGDG